MVVVQDGAGAGHAIHRDAHGFWVLNHTVVDGVDRHGEVFDPSRYGDGACDWVVGHAVAEARRRVVVAAGRGVAAQAEWVGRIALRCFAQGHGVDQRVAFNHAVVADAWRARFNADHARLVVVQDGAGRGVRRRADAVVTASFDFDDHGFIAFVDLIRCRINRYGGAGLTSRNGHAGDRAGIVGARSGRAAGSQINHNIHRRWLIHRHCINQISRVILFHRCRRHTDTHYRRNQINAVAFGIGRTAHIAGSIYADDFGVNHVVAISHQVGARYVDAEALVCCYHTSELFAVHGQGHGVARFGVTTHGTRHRNILTGFNRIDGVIRGDVFVQGDGRLRWGTVNIRCIHSFRRCIARRVSYSGCNR